MRKRFSAVFLLSFFLPLIVSAITPVSQYNDLVAGEGEAGYRDGPFYRAQFNHPSGLALSADGKVLAIGAPKEDGAAVGVNGKSVKSAVNSGAAYVYY